MQNKRLIILAIALLIVATVSVILWEYNPKPATQNSPEQGNQPIGGQTDENGCLSPAGYAFFDKVGACARSFELQDENLQKAAAIVVASLEFSKGLTVTKVEPVGKTDGSYRVTLEKPDGSGKMIMTAVLKKWKVSSFESAPGPTE
ncbi:MAG: hypothetical protein ACM3KM_00285 [Acidobacteriaceae bacterium]